MKLQARKGPAEVRSSAKAQRRPKVTAVQKVAALQRQNEELARNIEASRACCKAVQQEVRAIIPTLPSLAFACVVHCSVNLISLGTCSSFKTPSKQLESSCSMPFEPSSAGLVQIVLAVHACLHCMSFGHCLAVIKRSTVKVLGFWLSHAMLARWTLSTLSNYF